MSFINGQGNKLTHDQHKQFKKDTNKAKSLYSISPQSNLYVPIMDLPQKLPSYLKVDRQSEWQTTALISSGLETVTLPSRLRPYHDFESSLTGADGTHTIFELQTSFNPWENGKKLASKEDGSAQAESEFDIDFTYDGESSKTPHIFNQVQVLRGSEQEQLSEPANEDVGRLRKLRLYNSDPQLQR